MLVLTRRPGQSIMIDDNVELKVLKVGGSQAQIGLRAPKRMAVHRKGVWERIQAEPSVGSATTTKHRART